MLGINRYNMSTISLNKLKRRPVDKVSCKPRKTERFDGLTEDELQKYTLPDYLDKNLDLVIIGINPSLMAAHRGRYYAGPGNHFYKLLYKAQLLPRLFNSDEDYKLLQFGIGLTNIVDRPTRCSSDLKRSELKAGTPIIKEKLQKFKPKIAVFNGKCIYEAFVDNPSKSLNLGLQPNYVGDTAMWVVPSSSARCANFPRLEDKLPYYVALKRFLDYLKGTIEDIDIKEMVFEGKCMPAIPTTSKMWRRKAPSAFVLGGKIANKETLSLNASYDDVLYAYSTEFRVIKNVEKNKQDPTDTKDTNVTEAECAKLSVETECANMSTEAECVKLSTEMECTKTATGVECTLITADTECVKISDERACTKNLAEVSSKSTASKYFKVRKNKKTPAMKPTIKALPSWKPVNAEPVDFVNLIKQRLAKKAHEENQTV